MLRRFARSRCCARISDAPRRPRIHAFRLEADYEPAGDQPQAIAKLVEGLESGLAHQTLLGVTGSGKTFTIANVIQQRAAPDAGDGAQQDAGGAALRRVPGVLPAQRGRVFRLATTTTTSPRPTSLRRDTYIEKDASINEHIEQMRLSATKALLERRDAIIVATVSAIYGLGDPRGVPRDGAAPGARRPHRPARAAAPPRRHAVHAQRARPARRAPIACAATSSTSSRRNRSAKRVRVELFDDEIETLALFDPLTGEIAAQGAALHGLSRRRTT